MSNSAATAGQSAAHLPADGCLSFLWPALSAFAIRAEDRQRIEEAVRHFAPVPRIALELRLHASDSAPDVHQMVLQRADEMSALTDYLERSGGALYPAGLGDLMTTWNETKSTPPHIFFEWDFDRLHEAAAVFLPIDAKDDDAPDHTHRAKLLRQWTALTGIAVDSDMYQAATGPVSVSHIGAMSQRGNVWRVNYRNVRVGQLGTLLRDLHSSADIASVSELFDELVEVADVVTVAVNFRDGVVTPEVGFEILFDEQPVFEPRWARLFARLCELGLCTADEAQSLLAMPAQIHPYTAGQPWPASWILATELSPRRGVPRVGRALSHVKVSVSADRALSAKVYVSAQHHWSDDAVAEAVPIAAATPTFTRAVDGAIAFLLRKQRQNGLWTEFRTRLGPSDEWTTAFVACALAGSGDETALTATKFAAGRLLLRQRANGGWGYNTSSPADADSTAWVLRLLTQLESSGQPYESGIRFLGEHILADGGVTTYRPQCAIEFAHGEPTEDDAGWKAHHRCVAANALPFLNAHEREAFVSEQNPDGSWTPYWWRTPALATALAAEALAGDDRYRQPLDRAVLWARSYQPPHASAFVEAWLIRILALGDASAQHLAAERAHALLRAQLPDGSWPAGADLKIPDPHDIDGSSAPCTNYETGRLFTTACVLMALSLPSLQTPPLLPERCEV